MEVSTKIHAGAGRLQASVDAGLALGAEHGLAARADHRRRSGHTQGDPGPADAARSAGPAKRAALACRSASRWRWRSAARAARRPRCAARITRPRSPIAAVRALSGRVRCVLDAGGRGRHQHRGSAVARDHQARRRARARCAGRHPRGSPHRRMTWDESAALFTDTVADTCRKRSRRWWTSSRASTNRPPRGRSPTPLSLRAPDIWAAAPLTTTASSRSSYTIRSRPDPGATPGNREALSGSREDLGDQ